MKLGVVADEIDADFHRAVSIGGQIGLRRYEVRFLKTGRAPMCSAEELREVERVRDGEGVEIIALSPGLFKHAKSERDFRCEMNDLFPRAVELAVRWRLSGLIVFGFQKPNANEARGVFPPSDNPPSFLLDALAEAGERARKAGLHLMIEPEPICRADTFKATVSLIQSASSPALKINYDPGNVAWLTNQDPLHEFDCAAPFIANVHVKNLQARAGNEKARAPVWTAPDEGLIDYAAHFKKLRATGYAGGVSLEPHMDKSIETLAGCKLAVERMLNTSDA